MIPTKKSWYIFCVFVNFFFQTTESFTHTQKKILSSLSYYSALAIPYVLDIRAYGKNYYHAHELVEPSVDAFVRTILKKYECSESVWKSVRIVHGRRFACDSIWNTIEVPISEKYLKAALHVHSCRVKNCAQCSSYNGYITQDSLSRLIGAILHEVGHLEHKDLQVWIGSTVATPICVDRMIGIAARYYACTKFGVDFKKYTTPWQRAIYKLCTTIVLSDFVLTGIKKNTERCADQFAIDHIHNSEVLAAISREFIEDHVQVRKNLPAWKQKLYDRFPLLYELTTKNHPSNRARARLFGDAAIVLREIHKSTYPS